MHKASCGLRVGNGSWLGLWKRRLGILLLAPISLVPLAPMGWANHTGSERHSLENHHTSLGEGHQIPGAPFKVFLNNGNPSTTGEGLAEDQATDAIETVVEALTIMTQNRTQHKRFDEALTKNALQKVIIEPQVFNREGKEFPFLVARTKDKGKVKLLISASALEDNGYLHNPRKLTPVLAREFQWVVIKAETTPKSKQVYIKRDLKMPRLKPTKKSVICQWRLA